MTDAGDHVPAPRLPPRCSTAHAASLSVGSGVCDCPLPCVGPSPCVMHDRWTPVGMTGEDKSATGHPLASGPQIRPLVTDLLQVLHRDVTNRCRLLLVTPAFAGCALPSQRSVHPGGSRMPGSKQECTFVRLPSFLSSTSELSVCASVPGASPRTTPPGRLYPSPSRRRRRARLIGEGG